MTYSLVCVEFGQLRLVCVHVCVEVCVCLSMTRSETTRTASSALSPVSVCLKILHHFLVLLGALKINIYVTF